MKNRWIATLALAALAGGVLAGPGHAQSDRRTKREIRLMENIIDDMLIDSPNFLVQGRGVTDGDFDGGNAEFTFVASLVDRNWDNDDGRWWRFLDGRHGIIVIDKDDYDDEDDDAGTKARRTWSEHRLERQGRMYNRGKDEMMDVLLDYGDVLQSLTDAQSVTITAYLRKSDYFHKNHITRYMVTAKMGDLRAYAAGRLSRDQMEQKVVTKES